MTNTLFQNSENQIPSGAALYPTPPPQRRPKTLQILRNFTLFSTKKNTGYITDKSQEINLWFWTGMKQIHKLALWAKCKHTGLSETNGSVRLWHVQCYFSARGGAGRGGVKPPECQSPHVSKRQIAQPCLSCSSNQTEWIPQLDLFLCNDVTFLIRIKYRQFHKS